MTSLPIEYRRTRLITITGAERSAGNIRADVPCLTHGDANLLNITVAEQVTLQVRLPPLAQQRRMEALGGGQGYASLSAAAPPPMAPTPP